MSLARSAILPVLRSSVCTQCRRNLSTRSYYSRIPLQPRASLQPRLQPAFLSIRHHSTPPSGFKAYNYQQIKELSEKPSPERILIDVREPNEYEQGFIPTARNLPVKSQPDALFLPAEEFEERFGFEKPAQSQEVVFYCRSGVRSNAAAQLAQQVGYANVSEYRGSWLDWEKNGGSGGKA